MIDRETRTLELYLSFCQGKLKEHNDQITKEHYERMYLDAYHELHKLNKDRGREYMEWWVRYAKW